MPLAIVVILLILTFMGGFWSGGALNSSKKPGETTRNDSKNVQQSDVPVYPNNEREGDDAKPAKKQTIPPYLNSNDSEIEREYREGMESKRFKTTIDSLDKIVKDIRLKKSQIPEQDILKALKDVLGVSDLNYERAKNYDSQEQIELVKAIHSYQDRKLKEPLGYINDKQKTFNALKQEVESRF